MGPKLIDTCHCGRERAIGCWELDGVLIDPGPESALQTVLEALDEPPRALLLTHIHLDHAGATGALVQRFPDTEVWVHERGAPHLVDPSKLIASARRLYGDEMGKLWGEIVPVPEANIRPLAGGETIAVCGRQFDVRYTPGHASHHVVYRDRADGTAYVGDIAGVRIPPSEFVMAPTPPPDIDLELWQRSIDTVREMEPSQLALTHFGLADTGEQLEGVASALRRQGDLARELIEQDLDASVAEDRFAAELESRLREEADPETAAVAMQATSPRQMWLGLKRYWEKRADRVDASGLHDRARGGTG